MAVYPWELSIEDGEMSAWLRGRLNVTGDVDISGDLTITGGVGIAGAVTNNSAKMAVIASGSYLGDDSVNRAIPHGLSVIPKIIHIRRGDHATVFTIITPGYVDSTYDASTTHLAVTAVNSTNFYVGNATSYNSSANGGGLTFYWVALG